MFALEGGEVESLMWVSSDWRGILGRSDVLSTRSTSGCSICAVYRWWCDWSLGDSTHRLVELRLQHLAKGSVEHCLG